MATTRPSIGDRRRAKSRPVLGEAPAPVEAPAASPVDLEAPAEPKAKRVRPPREVPEGITRTSYYFPDEEWEAARAAFLADWYAGGEAASIARWISDAMHAFARMSPSERDGLIPDAERRSPNGEARGGAHTLSLDSDAIKAMKTAKTDDVAAGRKGDVDSAWVRGAIAVAVATARTREGGHLDPAPVRLPARLER